MTDSPRPTVESPMTNPLRDPVEVLAEALMAASWYDRSVVDSEDEDWTAQDLATAMLQFSPELAAALKVTPRVEGSPVTERYAGILHVLDSAREQGLTIHVATRATCAEHLEHGDDKSLLDTPEGSKG